jgi:hypothetical protein
MGSARKVKDQGDNITLKERGTSTDYTVARLDRDRPDLAAHVRAGHMSANAAAIEAGFRHKPTPFETVKRLWPKLTASEKSTIYSIDR